MVKYEKINNNKDLPLRILDIFLPEGDETIRKTIFTNGEGVVGKHWHRSLEIIVPVFGETVAWENNEEHELHHGDIYIISSNSIHDVYSRTNDPYKGYCLQINYDFLKAHIKNYDEIAFSYIENIGHKQELLACIYSIIAASFEEDEYINLQIEGKIMELLYLLLKYAKRKKEESIDVKSEKYKAQIMDIVKYIDDHYTTDLSINDIAEAFGFSYGYISRLFKEYLGVTIKNYIMMVRLKHSVNDLLYTDLPILQIAMKNGFPNVKSFYKEFEIKYKMTPSNYRKEMMK